MTATLHTVTAATAIDAAAASPPNYAARRAMAVVLAIVTLAAAAVLAGEVVGALVDLGGRPAAASEVPSATASPAVHVAQPGDTMWSIADAHRGEVSRDRYIDALVDLNGGAAIQAGQAVRLP